jgi:hypothetical protein
MMSKNLCTSLCVPAVVSLDPAKGPDDVVDIGGVPLSPEVAGGGEDDHLANVWSAFLIWKKSAGKKIIGGECVGKKNVINPTAFSHQSC